MKILYNDVNLEKDFKHFKEWFYIISSSGTMKKNGYFGNTNFLGKNIITLLMWIIASIIWINIYNNSDETFLNILSIILISISIFYILFYIFAIFGYFIHYNNFKKQKENSKKKNRLVISEDGIIDNTDDITLSSKWDKLTHVFIGEYYITITTVTNIVYIFPIDIKNRLLTGINKYNTNKELKIILKNI